MPPSQVLVTEPFLNTLKSFSVLVGGVTTGATTFTVMKSVVAFPALSVAV